MELKTSTHNYKHIIGTFERGWNLAVSTHITINISLGEMRTGNHDVGVHLRGGGAELSIQRGGGSYFYM